MAGLQRRSSVKSMPSDLPDGRGKQVDVPSREAPGKGAAVTYVPKYRAFAAGEHRSMPGGMAGIEAYRVEYDASRDAPRIDGCEDAVHTGLMRAYLEIREFQRNRLPLDCMFDTFGLDGPSGTMRFPTNRRGRNLGFYDIAFDLKNAAEKIDVHFPVRKTPPAENALLAEREKQALASLKQLRYHYRKDGSDDEAKFARETAPTDNGTQRIFDPAPDTSPVDNIANEIHVCRGEFAHTFGPWLNRFACSGKTAARIARKPRAARGLGPCAVHEGVYGFPGIPDSLMCVSNACDDGVLYATGGHVRPHSQMPAALCSDSVLYDAPWGVGGLVKAEGPKIVRREGGQPEDYTLTDSYQYMCVHEDLPADCRFGCIIDLQTT